MIKDTAKEIPNGKKFFNTLQKKLKYEANNRLGGEQEARAVMGRLFNRNGTPYPHYSDALIVFGGKGGVSPNANLDTNSPSGNIKVLTLTNPQAPKKQKSLRLEKYSARNRQYAR